MRTAFLATLAFFSAVLLSCSVQKRIDRSAKTAVIKAPALATAHVGISIYDAEAKKYLYNHDGDKYFVPASNVKIPTCYAAMKYLGDSLVGLRYVNERGELNIQATGDPTFLHPDFKSQPVFDFLKKATIVNYELLPDPPSFTALGNGWAWNDYQSSYAAERSKMPIYGNVARFFIASDTLNVTPGYFYNSWIDHTNRVLKNGVGSYFNIVRPLDNNDFHAPTSNSAYRLRTKFNEQLVPFKTIINRHPTYLTLLQDTLHKALGSWDYLHVFPRFEQVIHSRPTDSLLKPMMHRSDNFFAEQALLMVSDAMLKSMDDAKIIDTILKTDFKDLPQKPRWVDGSGLSRYNLFTPQDFVFILNKMKDEFGMERLKTIFATGGEGTLSGYYKQDSSYLFAKTGTLSGVVAISGFMYTAKNKLLLFSVLVNNHQASGTEVRRAVEGFIQEIRKRY